MEFVRGDTKSRIMGSPQIKIEDPDDIMLMQVLGKQLTDKGFKPTVNVLRYAVPRMERSWNMCKRLSDTLSELSFEEKKNLSSKLVAAAIEKINGQDSSSELHRPEHDRRP